MRKYQKLLQIPGLLESHCWALKQCWSPAAAQVDALIWFDSASLVRRLDESVYRMNKCKCGILKLSYIGETEVFLSLPDGLAPFLNCPSSQIFTWTLTFKLSINYRMAFCIWALWASFCLGIFFPSPQRVCIAMLQRDRCFILELMLSQTSLKSTQMLSSSPDILKGWTELERQRKKWEISPVK